ncbi:MAG: type II secretion system F family protein [Magnetococcales bacterium]|nr:type II secretion system F family protein [Magnetococcales bacterium]MBF0172427.1 type II secretion system F family protein [Magnetococcales bacterium]MBF0631397.1 type II secretion system F family protein [Magnetococcales bacterium]
MAKVSIRALLFFTRQFSSMVNSHLHLRQILETMANDLSTDKKIRPILKSLSNDIDRGMDLALAMEVHKDVFNKDYISIIRSGVISGKLGVALEHLTRYLSEADQNRSRLLTAISYPVFIFTVFLVMFHILVLFILPRFDHIFKEFGKPLPDLTQWVLTFSRFYLDNIESMAAGAAIPAIVFLTTRIHPQVRLQWDMYKLNLPLLGSLWRLSALYRFLSSLGVQVKNGILIVDAIPLAGSASNNLYLESISRLVQKSIQNGVSVTGSFSPYSLFQGVALQMIRAAEESDSMADPLLSTARHFNELLQSRLHVITELVTPILTIILGMIITAMLVSAFLPIFELGGLQA